MAIFQRNVAAKRRGYDRSLAATEPHADFRLTRDFPGTICDTARLAAGTNRDEPINPE